MKSLDSQLLRELHDVIASGRLMPIGLMRILRARGWVLEGETRLDVEARVAHESDRVEMCDSTMVSFSLTRLGVRELLNFDCWEPA